MERHSLRPIAREAAPPVQAERSPLHFSRDEKRKVFKGMVISHLEAGFLRYSKRQALLKYGARMGIPEFEASLLIAEAQFNADEIDPVHFDSAATLEAIGRPEAWSIRLRLTFALAAAVLIDLLIIHWFLR